MNINDLKTGYLVKFRKEGYGVVACSDLGKIIIYSDYSSDSITDWRNDLTDSVSKSYDIVAVYKPKTKAHILSTLDDYELIWEREDLDDRASKACSEVQHKYKCIVTYETDNATTYNFKINYGEFDSKFYNIPISKYSLEQIVNMISEHIEWSIITHYKKYNQ